MNPNFNIGQRVYFLISGRIVTEAVVVAASAGLVTIKFRKNGDCIIRLPYHPKQMRRAMFVHVIGGCGNRKKKQETL